MIAFSLQSADVDLLPGIVAAVSRGIQSDDLKDVAGRAVANQLKRHFIRLNAERNRHGSNFYADAAEATGHSVSRDGVEVFVARLGIAQRYFGGTIRPTGGRKALAIPLRDEARGKSPGINADELPPLFFIRSRAGKAFLAARGPGGELRLFYRLVSMVVQKPDSSVLPPPEAMSSTAVRAINSATERHIRRALDHVGR